MTDFAIIVTMLVAPWFILAVAAWTAVVLKAEGKD